MGTYTKIKTIPLSIFNNAEYLAFLNSVLNLVPAPTGGDDRPEIESLDADVRTNGSPDIGLSAQFVQKMENDVMLLADTVDESRIAQETEQAAVHEANRDNLLGAFLYARRTDADPAKARERLAQFPAQLQNHPVLASVRREIEAVERSSVGRPYMDLTLKDADGETVALSSLAGPGRWVLLDFWATWCGPCCREIPYLKEAYAAFSGRGFSIYAVSIDHDAARWQRFLAENDLPWTNVLSPGCGKQSPAAAMYGIRFIPSNFLISPDGVIVARNLPGRQLQSRLEELMK